MVFFDFCSYMDQCSCLTYLIFSHNTGSKERPSCVNNVKGGRAQPASSTGTVFIHCTSMMLNPGFKPVKHVRGLKCTPDLWLTAADTHPPLLS